MQSRGDSAGSLFVTCNLVQKLEKAQPFRSYMELFSTEMELLASCAITAILASSAHLQRVCLKRLSKGTIHQAVLIHIKAPYSSIWIHLQAHLQKNDHRVRPFRFQAFLCQCIS